MEALIASIPGTILGTMALGISIYNLIRFEGKERSTHQITTALIDPFAGVDKPESKQSTVTADDDFREFDRPGPAELAEMELRKSKVK